METKQGQNWKDRTLALHVADAGSIPNILYYPLSTVSGRYAPNLELFLKELKKKSM